MMDVKRGRVELERGKVKGILDGFGEVLWAHLEEEVQILGAVSAGCCCCVVREMWGRRVRANCVKN